MNETQRGSDHGAGIEDLYRYHGFEVELVREATPTYVAKLLPDYRPRVVHVDCELRESPSFGGVYLDFGVRSNDYFGTTAFLNALRPLAPEEHPLLVLDVVGPPGRTEAWRQLFLRNAYCAALFESGSLPAILGTGLDEGWKRAERQEQLVDFLREGLAVGELCNRLRRRPDAGGPEELPGTEATALFAHDPGFIAFAEASGVWR